MIADSPLPPHPPLTGYYEAPPKRSRWVIDLFDRTARHYDTIERIFLNSGLWYRRRALRHAGLEPGMVVLDVAIGTAAVARGAARLVGRDGRVFGVDPSLGMLGQARQVFGGPVTRGVAESLPFASNTFDFVTMGIALRHVSDLVVTFAEYFRVLKPGGTVWVLEGHVPTSRLGLQLTRFMWARAIPAMTLLATGSRDAKELMDYYWDTVEQCVAPDAILRAMAQVGFVEPRYDVVVPGMFGTFTARKRSTVRRHEAMPLPA